MSFGFRSLIDGAKKLAINGTGSTSAPITELFAKADPAIDGYDCSHDCSTCSIHYPRNFKIDHDDRLYGFVKGWSTHLIVATGKSDWVRDVADEKGSVMEAVNGASNPTNGVSSYVLRLWRIGHPWVHVSTFAPLLTQLLCICSA